MTMERPADLDCVGFEASVTVTVKLKVLWEVGVPEMRPVLALRVVPGGRLPALIDQL
jgi:hypothetical protein